jgi:hypothetical protein
MAFGKHKDSDDVKEPDAVTGVNDIDELEGPFDIDDFDDPSTAELGRLDLGSVLIPMPEAGQVQVELSEMGVPSAVWVVTPNGRFTIAAYAAPKTAGLWREVATELADSLRKDVPKVSIEDGPWGREIVGVSKAEQDQPPASVRFIGVDGYRWMIRCVVNGPWWTKSWRWPPKRGMRWRTPLSARRDANAGPHPVTGATARADGGAAARGRGTGRPAAGSTGAAVPTAAATAPACRSPERAWVGHAAAADHHRRLDRTRGATRRPARPGRRHPTPPGSCPSR